jgi:enoyl-CoA hydratase
MSTLPETGAADPEQIGSEILVERRGPVTILTLNRPERLNALSFSLLRHLHRILDELEHDFEQRVVILAGAGRGFCSGTDLKNRASGARWKEGVGDIQGAYALQESVGRLVVRLRQIPQPVIAVVHGVAAGGGLSLACAADLRIAEPAARFNAAFVKLGVSGGDMGSSWFLPRIMGFERAADLLYTGRMLDAQEAQASGLVSHIVEPGEGLTAAMCLANEMCTLAPFTTRMTKSLLNLSRDGATLAQMIEMENRTQILMTQTQDFAEGVLALAERRPASFYDS